MQKTLIEAFVLVVIVVFLFLGSVRATLIPTLAVPVSLIGTFIVLLAIGYSANTVSLLAIVLAIGIVVDDAIVVVENVERVMEEHPELSPAEATKQAMSEITAPIIAITLVLLSVFVPVAFIPGISGELFRQFAVTVAVAMFLSAINALTLSPALCGVLLRPHHGPRRGVIGLRDALDRPGARRLWRRRRAAGAVFGHRPGDGRGRRASASLGLPRSRRPASCRRTTRARCSSSCSCRAAPRSRGRPRSSRQAEAILREEDRRSRTITSVIGLNFIDNYSQSECRLHGRHAQAVRGAQGPIARRARA